MNINILDYAPGKTFIYVNKDIRSKLFCQIIKTTLTDLSKNLSLKLKNVSRYKTGSRAIQKHIFLEMIKMSNMSLEDFQNEIIIKVGRTGNKVKIGPFVTIDSDWVYVSELIRGDGALCKGHNNSYNTRFVNKDLTLIEYVKNFFLNKGLSPENICIHSHIYQPEVKILIIHSELISYFLNSFFKIDFGHKRDTPLPEFIVNNKNFGISAVRGIFDAEGSVQYAKWKGRTLRRVQISMKDELYLKDIQNILSKLEIDSKLYKEKDRVMFRLFIGGRNNIIRFYRKIKPLNTKRNEKLRGLVENYKNTDWISSKDLIPKILKLLLNGPKKRSEICHNLNISYSKAGLRLKNLKKNGLIKADKFERHWCIYSITDKGQHYLKTGVTADLP
ncbi:MAG: LAGLIDADG family homing endonuclease [Nanoarchaeota archaeon]|nr:LAGLIDADG family homing endonuclease [Nanoarchaeota archaeon]